MLKKEAYEIYDKVRKDEFPPTNPIVLSKAQLIFAEEGQPKMAACIAQWLVQIEGGNIDLDTYKNLCEL
jgi:hypothetical protein